MTAVNITCCHLCCRCSTTSGNEQCLCRCRSNRSPNSKPHGVSAGPKPVPQKTWPQPRRRRGR